MRDPWVSTPQGRFKRGDRVRLIGDFWCPGDPPDLDKEIDSKIRNHLEPGEKPIGIVFRSSGDSDLVLVDFPGTGEYWVGEGVLELTEPPVTDDEVRAAIESINEALGGSDG